MINPKVKFINSRSVFCAIFFIFYSLNFGAAQIPNQTVNQGDDRINLGEQKFNFSSPKTVFEREDSKVQGRFPKIIVDKPVEPDKYTLGVGDRLLLVSMGRLESNVPLTVGPEGKIIIPDIGDIEVAGQTLTQIRQIIVSKMKRKYPNLDFRLLLAEPRAFKIYVLGEVNNPGVYAMTALDRVSDAIGQAGGIKNSGTKRKIEIRRKDKIIYADLYSLILHGSMENNPPLLDNDMVFVPLSLSKVTIGGGIRRPGVYELEGEENLKHFIDRIGGLVHRLPKGKPIKIERFLTRTDKKTFEIDIKDIENVKIRPFILKDGDTVYVPAIDQSPANDTSIYVTGEVKKPGPYPYLPGYTAKSYIGIAGGLTTRARFSQARIIKSDGRKIPLTEDTIIELGDTVDVPEKFIKVWQDCLVITTSVSSLTLAVIAAFK